MNKRIFILLCTAFFLTGCAKSEPIKSDVPSTAIEESVTSEYTSKIESEECALCNQAGNTLLPIYAGQNNLGIICINTFNMSPILINRYDDYGHLIEKPAQSISTTHNSFGEGEMTTTISPDTDRGYASAHVYFTKDREIDSKKIESLLCQNCLNKIFDQLWDTPYGIGIINFATLEVKLLQEDVTGFSFDDYYIHIDHRENKEDSEDTELSLLIFYCPERYK